MDFFRNYKPWFGLKGSWLTFWITVACATDMTLFGYDQGVFSGVVISQDYLDTLGLNGEANTNTLAIITSIYDIGCFFGAVAAFTFGEKYGRKKSIFFGSFLMTIGAITQASAFTVRRMICGRIASGIGNGINTATAPVWQTETSQGKWRGKLVMLEMMMNIFGFMLVNWINYGLSFAGGSVAWRLPLALQLIFILVLFTTVPWLPESPRWLIAHGREQEALTILADLENKSRNDPAIIASQREIIYSVEYERNNAVGWRDILRGRSESGTKPVRRMLLGVASQLFQQLAGINVLSYYLPTLLKASVGLPDSLARLLAAVSSAVYFVASGIATPLVERSGRRTMMMVSTAIQAFCFFMITILLYYSEKLGYSGQLAVASASVVFFFLYYVGFGLGMLGIPWLYPTEINSLPMRTKGAAMATMTNWIINFLVVEVTPIGVQNLGWKFYIVWTFTNAAILPLIYLFFPETADRNLEDIDAYYREDPSLIVIKDPDAISRRRPSKYIEAEKRDVRRAAGIGNYSSGESASTDNAERV